MVIQKLLMQAINVSLKARNVRGTALRRSTRCTGGGEVSLWMQSANTSHSHFLSGKNQFFQRMVPYLAALPTWFAFFGVKPGVGVGNVKG